MIYIDKLLLFRESTSKADLKAGRNLLLNLEEYALSAEANYSMDSNHTLTVVLDVDLLGDNINVIPQKGIIKTVANNREDYWVIVNIDKSLDELELSCRHIVTEYMLSTFIADSKPRILNCNDMLNHLKQNSESYLKGRQYAKDLETYSNLDSKDYKNKNIWRKNFYDTVNELQELFGGEIRKEGFEIGIVDHVGSKKSVYSIEYGKNLISNTSEEDLDIVIGVCPKGYDKLYTDIVVYSPKMASNPNILGRIEEIEYPIRLIEYDENGEEIGERDGNYQYYDNEEEARAELTRLAGLEFTQNHIDEPKIAFDTTFLDLSLVEECRDLDRVYLSAGDTVSTSIPKFNLNIETRVIELKVDILADEITNITLSNNDINQLKPPSLNYAIEQLTKTEAKFESIIGDKVLGLNSTISQTADKILLKVEDTKKELESSITQTADEIRLEVKNTADELQASIDINAEAITQKVSNKDFESYKEQTAEQISQKVSKGTEFNTEFTQTAKDFNFKIGSDGMNVNINKDALDIKGGAINVWDKTNTKKMIYLGSNGNAIFGGDIRLELANNPSKYVEFKSVPYVNDIGCAIVLGGASLQNEFCIQNPDGVRYFWVNYDGVYASNNFCITSDQEGSSTIYTGVIMDDGIIYPNTDNRGKIGTTVRRWREINGVTGQFYDLTVDNLLSTHAINTNNNNVDMGRGNITCGGGTVNGSLSITSGLKVRGTTDLGSVDAGYVSATSLDVGGQSVVLANGSSSSNQVRGLAVRFADKTYLEVQAEDRNVYGADLWNSDISLKENIIDIEKNEVVTFEETNNKIGLDAIKNIEHYSFDYKGRENSHVDCGYISQQLMEVNPNFVFGIEQEDGSILYSPAPSAIIPTLSLAIKEQQKYIEKLEERIDRLESIINK